MVATTHSAALDRITSEVIRHGLAAAAEQMAVSVERSARSQVVREMLDYSTAVFDTTGGIIAQSTRIPIHLNSMTRPLRRILDDFPGGEWEDGDVFITNDPYSGGQHLPDIMTFAPVMAEGSMISIVGTIVHHADVGGRAPASYGADATELFQEGFQIPPMRIVSGGRWDDTFLTLFGKNIRLPQLTLGDLRSQVAALSIGAEEVLRLVGRYGDSVFTAATRELVDGARRVMVEAIEALPLGRFRAEDVIDGDGLEDVPVRIQVEVRHETPGALQIDFSGSDAQVRGPINSPIGATESAAYYGASAILQPGVTPICGAYEPLEVIAEHGSALNPRHPAPVVGRSVFAHRIANIVMTALSEAVPERACAHHYGNSNVTILSHRSIAGQARVLFEIGVGGWGGRPGSDGPDGLSQGVHNLRNNPVELLEQDFPFRVLNYSFIPDSGGPGQYRGGLALERRLLILENSEFSAQFDRMKFAVPGLLGGGGGAAAELWLLRDGEEPVPIAAKTVGLQLRAGDVMLVRTQGGGGLGSPAERSPELLTRDLRLGKITERGLRESYGRNPQNLGEVEKV